MWSIGISLPILGEFYQFEGILPSPKYALHVLVIFVNIIISGGLDNPKKIPLTCNVVTTVNYVDLAHL